MIRTDVKMPYRFCGSDIKKELSRTLPIEINEIEEVRILKKTLSVKDSGYLLSVALSLSAEREAGLLKMRKRVFSVPDYSLEIPRVKLPLPPVVVGAGPAGLFAALALAEAGANPIVIERGDDVEARKTAVRTFFHCAFLDGESNIQFGEGGAGAFSDGKLKVGSMDKFKYKILDEFVKCGAPEDIIYTVGAHLGTDKLPIIVANIREKIKALGGKFLYRTRVCGIKTAGGKISAVITESGGKQSLIEAERVFLATGHSAHDTFEMLLGLGVAMEQRGFGIGMRIEHPREYINGLVLGDVSEAEVGAASYHLVTHLQNGRSVYSFCMCPGGTVVAAGSEEGGICTNGMSEYARDAENSNAALLVSLTPRDFGSEDVLAGIRLQRSIEAAAFAAGGSDYRAPAIRLADFCAKSRAERFAGVKPSYPLGASPVCAEQYLPEFITDSLRAGILDFDAWMPGFNYPDAILTGAETRSTSPIRILRGEDYSSLTLAGLYPIGEGAGYAGGIVSSARDGLMAALSFLGECSRNK